MARFQLLNVTALSFNIKSYDTILLVIKTCITRDMPNLKIRPCTQSPGWNTEQIKLQLLILVSLW